MFGPVARLDSKVLKIQTFFLLIRFFRLPGDLCDTNCTWKPYDLELVNNLIIDIDGAPKIRLNLDIER